MPEKILRLLDKEMKKVVVKLIDWLVEVVNNYEKIDRFRV